MLFSAPTLVDLYPKLEYSPLLSRKPQPQTAHQERELDNLFSLESAIVSGTVYNAKSALLQVRLILGQVSFEHLFLSRHSSLSLSLGFGVAGFGLRVFIRDWEFSVDRKLQIHFRSNTRCESI